MYLRFLPAINRLDRLTSGLMIIPLTAECARNLSSEFAEGTIQKEYIARCLGEFSEYVVTSALATSLRLELRWSSTELSVARDEVVCDQPLLTVDRQMGLNIVHPEGKVCLIIFLFCISLYAYGTCLVLQPAKTKFKRLHYDLATNTSVLHCTCKLQRELRDYTLTRYIQGRPLTGRCACSFFSLSIRCGILVLISRCSVVIAHQIRVHLQYLGHPIANDPVYSETKIWVCPFKLVHVA